MSETVLIVPIARIKVIDRTRKHPEEKIHELQDSIKQLGLLHPITIDSNYKLLAGERRLLAHKNMGLTAIKCIMQEDSENKDQKWYIELDENVKRLDLTWYERAQLEKKIFDLQKENDPSWNQRKQQKLVHPVSLGGASSVNMRLQLAEALETMPELANYTTQEEAFKELKRYEEHEAKMALVLRKPKDIEEAPLWAEEHYKIGDAINGMGTFLKGQPHSQGKAFQFAEVDPPYGVDLHRRKGRNSDNQSMEEYLEWDDFPKLFETTASLVKDCLEPHAFAVFWYGMSRHQEVLGILRRVGWTVPDIPAIWYKGEIGQ